MRIWTFGCSFTEFDWPTWADILINHVGHNGGSGKNWGRCGAGNQYIATKIWECNARHRFTPDDWVFICWTGFTREDRYTTERGWQSPGNLGNQDIYNDNFIRAWADEKHYAMRDAMLIQSTQLALSKLGVNFLNWTMQPIKQKTGAFSFFTSDSTDEVFDLYNLQFDGPSMMVFNNTVDQRPERGKHRIQTRWDDNCQPIPEWHPYPWEHLNYINSNLVDKVSWLADGIHPSTLKFVSHWKRQITAMPQPILLNSINWKPITDSKQW
jgi:hypothetical protein